MEQKRQVETPTKSQVFLEFCVSISFVISVIFASGLSLILAHAFFIALIFTMPFNKNKDTSAIKGGFIIYYVGGFIFNFLLVDDFILEKAVDALMGGSFLFVIVVVMFICHFVRLLISNYNDFSNLGAGLLIGTTIILFIIVFLGNILDPLKLNTGLLLENVLGYPPATYSLTPVYHEINGDVYHISNHCIALDNANRVTVTTLRSAEYYNSFDACEVCLPR